MLKHPKISEIAGKSGDEVTAKWLDAISEDLQKIDSRLLIVELHNLQVKKAFADSIDTMEQLRGCLNEFERHVAEIRGKLSTTGNNYFEGGMSEIKIDNKGDMSDMNVGDGEKADSQVRTDQQNVGNKQVGMPPTVKKGLTITGVVGFLITVGGWYFEAHKWWSSNGEENPPSIVEKFLPEPKEDGGKD